MPETFDAIVIGTGQSGPSLAARVAGTGMKTAIIERKLFGGTCVNVGCIPTKMFAYPAGLAAVPAEASRLGVELTRDTVRWNAIRDRIFGRIDAISESGRRYRSHGNATRCCGPCSSALGPPDRADRGDRA